MLGTTTMALLVVALGAAAGFVVVAQRRLRQLGMLAAVGATERHLRLVTVANGVVIGVAAAGTGAVVGVAGWTAAVPFLEPAFGHRIAPFDVPWWLIATAMLLAVVTATGAAWGPARAAARIPIVPALTGRPPTPRPAHRSAALAVVLLVAGVASLVSAGEIGDETGVNWTNALVLAAGTLATMLGVLLVSPLAIGALARCTGRPPVALRLSVRDLARYQSRSGAALAAITLVLAIPIAIVVTASAAEHGADDGNLSDRQVMVRIGDPGAPLPPDFSPFVPERTPAELEDLEAQVNRIAALLAQPTVAAVDVAHDPALESDPRLEG